MGACAKWVDGRYGIVGDLGVVCGAAGGVGERLARAGITVEWETGVLAAWKAKG